MGRNDELLHLEFGMAFMKEGISTGIISLVSGAVIELNIWNYISISKI